MTRWRRHLSSPSLFLLGRIAGIVCDLFAPKMLTVHANTIKLTGNARRIKDRIDAAARTPSLWE